MSIKLNHMLNPFVCNLDAPACIIGVNKFQGAQEVFQELPCEYVPPEMLRKVAEHGSMQC